MNICRFAVIGVGKMGQTHLRVLSHLSGARVVGICDTDVKLGERIAAIYNTKFYPKYRSLAESVQFDAAIISVPTSYHLKVATECLETRIPILIEKPLAPTVGQCEKIIDLSRKFQTLASVGHLERFNPVVLELKKQIKQKKLGKIYQVNINRVGQLPNHKTDTGVLLDLASHDVDLLYFLFDSEIVGVSSLTSRVRNLPYEDLAVNLIKLKNGVIALLMENWVSPRKERFITIVGDKGMYKADFLTQDLFYYKNKISSDQWELLQVFRGSVEGEMTKFAINRAEPLRLELLGFMNAVLKKSKFPITLEDGKNAVRDVQKLLQHSQIVST